MTAKLLNPALFLVLLASKVQSQYDPSWTKLNQYTGYADMMTYFLPSLSSKVNLNLEVDKSDALYEGLKGYHTFLPFVAS